MPLRISWVIRSSTQRAEEMFCARSLIPGWSRIAPITSEPTAPIRTTPIADATSSSTSVKPASRRPWSLRLSADSHRTTLKRLVAGLWSAVPTPLIALTAKTWRPRPSLARRSRRAARLPAAPVDPAGEARPFLPGRVREAEDDLALPGLRAGAEGDQRLRRHRRSASHVGRFLLAGSFLLPPDPATGASAAFARRSPGGGGGGSVGGSCGGSEGVSCV